MKFTVTAKLSINVEVEIEANSKIEAERLAYKSLEEIDLTYPNGIEVNETLNIVICEVKQGDF